MRQLLFTTLIALIGTLAKFKGTDGTNRVFDFPTTSPGGYPYAVIGSVSFESSVLDNVRDTRRYNFSIQVVGEKFGDQAGLSQSDALSAMRTAEDDLIALFDANWELGLPGQVIRTMPTNAEYGFTDNGSRVVLTMHLQVDTIATISL